MSHNPNRAMGRNNRRAARRNDPHAGHKRKRGSGPQGVDLADIQNRESTIRGWKVTYFRGDEFEMVYELIAAGNASGLIRHNEADRSVRILRGRLFVLMGSETITVREGQAFSFPKGTEYEMASDTHDDVELLFCQGSGYEDGVEIIRESDALNAVPKTIVTQRQDIPERNPTGKAMEAAQKLAAERTQRQAARNPTKKKLPTTLAGQNEPGANLRPMGDPGEANIE